jgi:alpha-N-arabinofuranosidase
MANIAQTVNVLQAMVLTEKEKMVLTPTYHVFEMYKVHQGATLIPVELNSPQSGQGDTAVPTLNASASRDSSGRLHLSLVNLDPKLEVHLATKLSGAAAKSVSGRILTGPAINSMNTFENPGAVKPAAFSGARIQGDQILLSLPARSVVVLEIQ